MTDAGDHHMASLTRSGSILSGGMHSASVYDSHHHSHNRHHSGYPSSSSAAASATARPEHRLARHVSSTVRARMSAYGAEMESLRQALRQALKEHIISGNSSSGSGGGGAVTPPVGHTAVDYACAAIRKAATYFRADIRAILSADRAAELDTLRTAWMLECQIFSDLIAEADVSGQAAGAEYIAEILGHDADGRPLFEHTITSTGVHVPTEATAPVATLWRLLVTTNGTITALERRRRLLLEAGDVAAAEDTAAEIERERRRLQARQKEDRQRHEGLAREHKTRTQADRAVAAAYALHGSHAHRMRRLRDDATARLRSIEVAGRKIKHQHRTEQRALDAKNGDGGFSAAMATVDNSISASVNRSIVTSGGVRGVATVRPQPVVPGLSNGLHAPFVVPMEAEGGSASQQRGDGLGLPPTPLLCGVRILPENQYTNPYRGGRHSPMGSGTGPLHALAVGASGAQCASGCAADDGRLSPRPFGTQPRAATASSTSRSAGNSGGGTAALSALGGTGSVVELTGERLQQQLADVLELGPGAPNNTGAFSSAIFTVKTSTPSANKKGNTINNTVVDVDDLSSPPPTPAAHDSGLRNLASTAATVKAHVAMRVASAGAATTRFRCSLPPTTTARATTPIDDRLQSLGLSPPPSRNTATRGGSSITTQRVDNDAERLLISPSFSAFGGGLGAGAGGARSASAAQVRRAEQLFAEAEAAAAGSGGGAGAGRPPAPTRRTIRSVSRCSITPTIARLFTNRPGTAQSATASHFSPSASPSSAAHRASIATLRRTEEDVLVPSGALSGPTAARSGSSPNSTTAAAAGGSGGGVAITSSSVGRQPFRSNIRPSSVGLEALRTAAVLPPPPPTMSSMPSIHGGTSRPASGSSGVRGGGPYHYGGSHNPIVPIENILPMLMGGAD